MTDRQALLQAVLQAPLDPGPRLIFADWLEEYGDEVADRAWAECIRVQCGLAFPAITERERDRLTGELLRLIVWMPLFVSWPAHLPREMVRVDWHGGMISGVHCLWRDWIRKARRACRAWPVTAVHLRGKEPSLVTPGIGLHYCWRVQHRCSEADTVSARLDGFLTPPHTDQGWVYDSEEQAKADLARAAASWGRSLVGLPPIPVPSFAVAAQEG